MLLNSRQFKFLKNYRIVYGKSSAKREYRDENVSLKGDRAWSKLIILLISNKKEFNHFFKSRSDIVLLKLGNLHPNAKRSETRNTERDENVRAKRADFFYYFYLKGVTLFLVLWSIKFKFGHESLCLLDFSGDVYAKYRRITWRLLKLWLG